MMLLRLLREMNRQAFQSSVITLSGEGVVADHIRRIGVPVTSLDIRYDRVISGTRQLVKKLRQQQPDIIQTWMYHADLLGSVASVYLPGVPLIWNIRCGRLERSIDKLSTIWISRACAALSRFRPAAIVCCSQASFESHASAGYTRKKMRVIPNGFDTDTFRPRHHAQRALRQELGTCPDAILVGLVARFNPAKDHATFCRAAGIVATLDPRVHFVLCGEGVTAANATLAAQRQAPGLASRFHLLGRRDDVPQVMAGLDLLVSSSIVEGFPNVIAEAMSCGVACIATDVGDSRAIVGDAGFIVPIRDASALAASILKAIQLPDSERAALSVAARRRIREQFALSNTVQKYEHLYQELAPTCAA